MKAPYYFPLTHRSAKAFIEQGKAFDEPIEAAAMFAALTRIKRGPPTVHLGHLVADAFHPFRKEPVDGHNLLMAARQELELQSFDSFMSKLREFGACLVLPERIQSRDWLGADGNYSHAFQETCMDSLETYEFSFDDPNATGEASDDWDDGVTTPKRQIFRLTGTRDQSVIARIVASMPDEHVAVEAYAGTGKTFLVMALKNGLRGGFTYIAPSAEHKFGAQALASAGQAIPIVTTFELLMRLSRHHAQRSGARSAPKVGRCGHKDDVQARYAGIRPIAGASIWAVMNRLRKAIYAWCSSDDAVLGERHFRNVGVTFQDMPSYIEAGNRLWDAMFSPTAQDERHFDVYLEHIAKRLALAGVGIPASFGTILIDEAHDLPLPLLRLLERYEGGCIWLGDPHQRLRGRMPQLSRAKSALMTTSLRTGVGAHDFIERTLQLSPARTMPDFRSAGDHFTSLRGYSASRELPDVGLRLYGNEWALLEAALRFKQAKASIQLLPESKRILERSVRNALAMFAGRYLPPTTTVNGAGTWDELATRLHQQGLQAIIRLFEKGYDEEKLSELLTYLAFTEKPEITLGLIDHAKNLEFDTVALAPCCYEDFGTQRGFQPVHASYLGMTRARAELWVPGDAMDRLRDLRSPLADWLELQDEAQLLEGS